MEKLAIQLGKLGSILGALAGLIELSIGTRILSWIGNKESPFVLGLVTMSLSSIAFFSIISVNKKELQTNDRKLAIFLGVLLPAVICFTTVGRLWYLPGSLLLFASFSLAFVFWIHPTTESSPLHVSRKIQINQIFGTIGSLLILASVGLAFFITTFGLFQSDFLIEGNHIRFQVVPMDIVRMDNLSTGLNMIDEYEISLVMFVYIMLMLGAAIALISSLTNSHLFKLIGSGIVLAGLILFLAEIYGVLGPMGVPYLNIRDLFGAIGLGWYIAMIGVVVIFIADIFQFNTCNY